MEENRPPTLHNFARAFYGHWAEAVSGGFSVPFTAAAIFAEGAWQVGFGLLAIGSAWFAGYGMWRAERRKTIELSDRLSACVTFCRLGTRSLRSFSRQR
jgi:hypothetical protein